MADEQDDLRAEIEYLRIRSKMHDRVIDAFSRRLADVQMHPALSIPALPGFETEDVE